MTDNPHTDDWLAMVASTNSSQTARDWTLLFASTAFPHRVVDRDLEPLPFESVDFSDRYVLVVSREDKERLYVLTRKMTGVEVSGLAGLYVYFLLLATAWIEDDGIAAWLIPSEFMDVNYGAALKGFLADRVTLIRAHRFDPDDVQFGDALVSSVVLVFRKQLPLGKFS